MGLKRIKQINNIVIKQDICTQMNYFGQMQANPNFGKYSCWHGNVCLEDRLTLEQAIEFCKQTTDYCSRGRKNG